MKLRKAFEGSAHLTPGHSVRDPATGSLCLWKRVTVDVRTARRTDHRLGRVFHVGRPAPGTDSRFGLSMEGSGLSITTCPDHLPPELKRDPYPRSRLVPRDGFGRFVDMHVLAGSPRATELTAWAVTLGLLKPERVAEVEMAWLDRGELNPPFLDTGDLVLNATAAYRRFCGEWSWMRTDDFDAAIVVSDTLDSIGIENAFRVVDGFVPGDAFLARWHEDFVVPPPLTIVEELAWLQIVEESGRWDGAWWDDLPSWILTSLPRGVIFGSKLDGWELLTYETEEDDPTTELDAWRHDPRLLVLGDA